MINKLLGDPYWDELPLIIETFMKNEPYYFIEYYESFEWFTRFQPVTVEGLMFLSGILASKNSPEKFWSASDEKYYARIEVSPEAAREALLSTDLSILHEHLVWHYIRKNISQENFDSIARESSLQKIFQSLIS